MTPAERKELNISMRALAGGDRAAFQRVFDLSWPVLKQYAARALAHASEAEDVAQEVLLKAFRQASTFEVEKDTLTWLLTLATYECMTLRQKTKRRRENYDADEMGAMASHELSPEQAAFNANLRIAVKETLSGLNVTDREAILAAVYDGERPLIAPATFRKRLQRSLEKFRSVWEEKYDDGY